MDSEPREDKIPPHTDDEMEAKGWKLFHYLLGDVPPPDDDETSRPSPFKSVLPRNSLDPEPLDKRDSKSGEKEA